MNTSRTVPASFILMFVVGFAMVFAPGCAERAANPVSDAGPTTSSNEFPRLMGDTSGCNTVSAVLQQTPGLTLQVSNSWVTYKPNSVLQPTIVSVAICNLDTVGITFYPKCQAFGPISNLVFLRKVSIKMNYVDAGLSETPPQDKAYNVFRQNEVTGQWDLYTHAKADSGQVKYDIMMNGLYAITRDSVWFTTGIIKPTTGGTLDLLNSSLTALPGAVSVPTEITFAITQAFPEGLPGATNRIFDFSPEGLTFDVPLTLSVSFPDAGFMTETTTALRFYYYNQTSGEWVPQPTVVDWQHQKFVVTLSHFSRYAFGR